MVDKMADQPSSPGGKKEEKDVKRTNSFTKFIRSPSRQNSMKKSPSNPLSKLLFRRKSSKRNDDDESSESNRDEPVDSGATEEETTLGSLLEEVKEVVETAIDDVTHPEKKDTTTAEQTTTDAPRSTDSSSEVKETTYDVVDRVQEGLEHVASEAKETKHALFGKFKEGLGRAKEGLKDEYGKAKEELKSKLHKEEKHQQQPLVEKKPSNVVDISTEKKPLVYEDVKAPNIAQRIQEEVVAVVSTIEAAKKKGETCQEESKGEGEVKKEESKEQGEIKKEDNCISSLAQGLEKLCLPWASKKED